ncbi:MAG: PDZ domain protein [Nitrospirae bacterium]|nr:MAG: PDZ domain protein [Nitrospirota bacterium]
MKNVNAVEIETVEPGSLAEQSGIRAGDRLVSLNRRRVRDAIDLLFYGSEPELRLAIQRGDKQISCYIDRGEGDGKGLGISLKPLRVKTCGNKCIFCFVMQLPKGLRKALYLKDEDYRFSFLYGNYITLTNLTRDERKRIVEQHLSPLYISVHATDMAVRRILLGNESAPDILKELKYFAGHGIRMHTQIVLCPGYNDKKILSSTINDLYKLYPYIQSIAIVPVGLTEHRRKPLTPVNRADAADALGIVHRFQARFRRKHGEGIVYAADELYLKAGLDIPPYKQYDELSQVENGIGLIALFRHQARRLKIPQFAPKRRFVTFTGTSFAPFLEVFAERLRRHGVDLQVIPVENTFFGKSVTVAGLLTGRDVMKALSGCLHKDDILLIPDVVMREGDQIFLDDVALNDVEDILGVRALLVAATPQGLLEGIQKSIESVRRIS